MTKDFDFSAMRKIERVGKPKVLDLLNNKCSNLTILEKSPKAELDQEGIDLIGQYKEEHVTLDIKIDSHGNSKNLIWEIKSNVEKDVEGWAHSATNIWVPCLGNFKDKNNKRIEPPMDSTKKVHKIKDYDVKHLFLFKMNRIKTHINNNLIHYKTVDVTTSGLYTTKSKLVPYTEIEGMALWSYHPTKQKTLFKQE